MKIYKPKYKKTATDERSRSEKLSVESWEDPEKDIDPNSLSYGSPYRDYGSTHRSSTKDRITRLGRKRARQEAKKLIKEEQRK